MNNKPSTTDNSTPPTQQQQQQPTSQRTFNSRSYQNGLLTQHSITDPKQQQLFNDFNNFVQCMSLSEANKPYVNLYESILSNPQFSHHITFSPKERLNSIGEFAFNKELTNKPYLSNIMVSHINKIIGYTFVNDVKRVYLVELKTKCDNKDYNEKAIICESLLLLKLKQKSISSKYIGNLTNISI